MANKLDFSHTKGQIESVVVTWRRADGLVQRMHVDPGHCRGIVWRYDEKNPNRPFDAFKTGKNFPRVPGTLVETVGRTYAKEIEYPQSEGFVCCFWDEGEGEWICPPEPEP